LSREATASFFIHGSPRFKVGDALLGTSHRMRALHPENRVINGLLKYRAGRVSNVIVHTA